MLLTLTFVIMLAKDTNQEIFYQPCQANIKQINSFFKKNQQGGVYITDSKKLNSCNTWYITTYQPLNTPLLKRKPPVTTLATNQKQLKAKHN